MIADYNLRSLAIIPARAGSKGVPGKNIRQLAGKSLVGRAIDVSRKSGCFGKILLSTDSLDIAKEGEACGLTVPFLRPRELSQDHSPMIEVVKHAIEFESKLGRRPDYIALLQPTSPFRRQETIRRAMEILWKTNVDSVVTVREVPEHLRPHFVFKTDPTTGYLSNFLAEGKNVTRRQDAPMAYYRTGIIYAFRINTLDKYGNIYGEKCVPLVINGNETVNIDSISDWEFAEKIAMELGPET